MRKKLVLPKSRSSQVGFSLIELLIVVTIILIIAAIAIPNFLRSKIAANESSAVASLRTISTAETTYASSWGVGYAPLLTNLGGPIPCTIATPAAACLVDPLLSNGANVKSGYSFAAVANTPAGGVNTGFEANATPTSVDITGKRAFCVDQTGVLRANTNGVAIGTGVGSCAAVVVLIIGQ